MGPMISVLVPYRPDGGHRDRAWDWVSRRWAALFPDAEVIVATDDGGENPGQFNHPQAINRAAAQACGDVLIVADADTAFDGHLVAEAADVIADGAPWVLPQDYLRLTEAASLDLLEQDPATEIGPISAEWKGATVSGIVIVSRDSFERVGGYDERIAWWGADDVCFAASMSTMCGEPVRLPGAAYHLWHPQPLGETYGHDRHREQHRLMGRYLRAKGHPESMRRVMAGR